MVYINAYVVVEAADAMGLPYSPAGEDEGEEAEGSSDDGSCGRDLNRIVAGNVF